MLVAWALPVSLCAEFFLEKRVNFGFNLLCKHRELECFYQ